MGRLRRLGSHRRLPGPHPKEVLDELSEARVRYLLSLDHPNLGWHLNGEDIITLQRRDPDAYARLQP